MLVNLLTNYLWVAVCLFVSALVNLTLGKIYVPIVGVLFGSGLIFMVTCLFLPYFIAQYLPVKMEGSEDEKRMYMLVACVVDYVTFMVLLAGAFVPFNAPPSFLLPLLIGVLADALGPSLGSQPRTVFLGSVLGVPAAASFVYGMFTGSLTGMYFVWLLAQLAVALVDVQMKISAFKGGKAADSASQGFSLICFLYVTFLMTVLTSGHEEKSADS
uniref:Uncharacterized protein n=1 Tax=Romanomermis culicivorax TaxID=13658 RepID=A0A915JAH0_ROMCU